MIQRDLRADADVEEETEGTKAICEHVSESFNVKTVLAHIKRQAISVLEKHGLDHTDIFTGDPKRGAALKRKYGLPFPVTGDKAALRQMTGLAPDAPIDCPPMPPEDAPEVVKDAVNLYQALAILQKHIKEKSLKGAALPPLVLDGCAFRQAYPLRELSAAGKKSPPRG